MVTEWSEFNQIIDNDRNGNREGELEYGTKLYNTGKSLIQRRIARE